MAWTLIRAVGRRVAIALIVVVAVLVGRPMAATAHAQLEKTSPSSGAELTVAPKQIELVFAEGVRPVPGGLRVVAEDGTRVDDSRPRSSGRTVTLALPVLADGAYVVSWRVVSADGHPVRGAFTFRVGGSGSQSIVAGLAEKLLLSGTSRGDVGTLAAVLRALSFAAIALLLGAAAHVLAVDRSPVRQLGPVIRFATVTAGLAGIGSVLLYGPLVTGQPFGGVTDATLLNDTLGDHVGQALVARTVLLVLLGITLLALVRSAGRSQAAMVGIGVVSVAVALAQAYTGHGANGRSVAIALPSTVVHVVAMGAWAGGLVMLLITLRTRGRSVAQNVDVTRQFSRNAGIAVGALFFSGAIAMWRQVGSVAAARTTPSGRLLLIKLGLVAILLLLGARNRRSLAAGGSGAVAAIGRTISFEVIGMAVVLAVTALVVNLAPARDVVSRPLALSVTTQTGLVDITVEPAKPGRNELHIYALTKTGAARPVESITATLSNAGADIERLETRIVRAGPNHFQALALDIPIGGTWRIDVAIKLDAFTEETGSSTFTLR